MSNGSLAELPPDSLPGSIDIPDDTAVMLLLPHNKYLLGTDGGQWIYGRQGAEGKSVYLYDNEGLSLFNDGAQPTVIPAETVNTLRRKLLMHSEPPGRHAGTILTLRTLMRDHKVFSSEGVEFLDEEAFARHMKNDEILEKAYWTLRFALARGEQEAIWRLKSWLKTGPEIFRKYEHSARLWFSILDLPDKDAISELEELSFSASELRRLSAQNISPLVLYNPSSGWLVLGRYGRGMNIMYSVWLYAEHDLWHELREQRKMTIQEIISSIWSEHDTREAMNERAKYK